MRIDELKLQLIFFLHYLTCFVLEIVACEIVWDAKEVICEYNKAIEVPLYLFLQFGGIPVIGDGLYILLGFLLFMLYDNIYNVMYNVVMCLTCLAGSITLLIEVGKADYKYQHILKNGTFVLIAAGIVHILNAIVTYWLSNDKNDENDAKNDIPGPTASGSNRHIAPEPETAQSLWWWIGGYNEERLSAPGHHRASPALQGKPAPQQNQVVPTRSAQTVQPPPSIINAPPSPRDIPTPAAGSAQTAEPATPNIHAPLSTPVRPARPAGSPEPAESAPSTRNAPLSRSVTPAPPDGSAQRTGTAPTAPPITPAALAPTVGPVPPASSPQTPEPAPPERQGLMLGSFFAPIFRQMNLDLIEEASDDENEPSRTRR